MTARSGAPLELGGRRIERKQATHPRVFSQSIGELGPRHRWPAFHGIVNQGHGLIDCEFDDNNIHDPINRDARPANRDPRGQIVEFVHMQAAEEPPCRHPGHAQESDNKEPDKKPRHFGLHAGSNGMQIV